MEQEQTNEFEAVMARLQEIACKVEDESLPLDEALDLYDEAVKLGLKASSLLEVGIVVEEEPAVGEGSETVGAGGAPAPATQD